MLGLTPMDITGQWIWQWKGNQSSKCLYKCISRPWYILFCKVHHVCCIISLVVQTICFCIDFVNRHFFELSSLYCIACTCNGLIGQKLWYIAHWCNERLLYFVHRLPQWPFLVLTFHRTYAHLTVNTLKSYNIMWAVVEETNVEAILVVMNIT